MNKNRKIKAHIQTYITIVMALMCLLFNNANFVFAGTGTGTLAVSATVPPKCKFIGASAEVSFGIYDPIGIHALLPNIAFSAFSVLCTKQTASQISMGPGLHASFATSTTRAMSNGAGEYLSYEIYTTSALTTIWNTTNTISYTNLGGGPAVITIFAKIPPGQNIAAGDFSDTVVTTINY